MDYSEFPKSTFHHQAPTEFQCRECGKVKNLRDKGQATLGGKLIDVCHDCCVDEQKR